MSVAMLDELTGRPQTCQETRRVTLCLRG